MPADASRGFAPAGLLPAWLGLRGGLAAQAPPSAGGATRSSSYSSRSKRRTAWARSAVVATAAIVQQKPKNRLQKRAKQLPGQCALELWSQMTILGVFGTSEHYIFT